MTRNSLFATSAALTVGASMLALAVASNFDAGKAHTLATQLATTVSETARSVTQSEPQSGAKPAPAAPAVEVVTVTTQVLAQYEEFTGRFEAVDHVEIRARVSGYLDTVHFKPGQRVSAGDLLFTIDPRPFEARLAEARAALVQAEAGVSFAESQVERARELSRQGHTSDATLDEREQEFANAKAAITAAEARLQSAELDLSFTRVKAPVSGRVSDDAITVGNLVAGGTNAPVLTTLVSTEPIHFVFDATEQQLLARIRDDIDNGDVRDRLDGTPVSVRLIDEQAFDHPGQIDFIDNRLDLATGTIRGRAVLDNPRGVLTPGMFGRMRLANSSPAKVALIPDEAIGTNQTEKFVWALDADNKAERRVVEIGGKRGRLRVITSGLSAGERIVTSGLHRVASGRTVQPQPTRLAKTAETSKTSSSN
ncbi:MAG: efflux RND transporter periplasmic adaptor subunit [Pseudomonadota bacterium]